VPAFAASFWENVMPVKKLDDSEMAVKRWPRTLNEAFGVGSPLTVEPKKMPLRDKLYSFSFAVAIGIGWYIVVLIKSGPR
jgi:hypothetical protein